MTTGARERDQLVEGRRGRDELGLRRAATPHRDHDHIAVAGEQAREMRGHSGLPDALARADDGDRRQLERLEHRRVETEVGADVRQAGRERNVIYDAGDTIECLQRAGVHLVLSGHKHVPYAWKLENLFVVNTGTVSTLRLRGHTRPCYNVVEVSGTHVDVWRRYPFHGQERIIQFDLATGEYEKYTGRIEREVSAKR